MDTNFHLLHQTYTGSNEWVGKESGNKSRPALAGTWALAELGKNATVVPATPSVLNPIPKWL